jgi:hypothetical protein
MASKQNQAPAPPPISRRVRRPVDWALYFAVLFYVLAFGLVTAATFYSFGVFPGTTITWTGVGFSLTGLTFLLGLVPIALMLNSLRRPMRQMRTLMERRFDDMLTALSQVREESALSDDARRVLNRSRERELLRRAIQEDIEAGDWDAGVVLAKELAERFGYRSDAEEFRGRIEQAREDTLKRQVDAAISLLDGLIVQRRWEAASLEAARIARLYPDSPRVQGLRERVDAARRHYREDLERRFLQASRDDDIEEAMRLLKELDHYLTPAEAEPYMEVARGVIGKARQNLGAQFKLAVQDRRWSDASYYGGKILDEFPNSRMAAEVRPAIDGIRERAAKMPAQTVQE